MTKIISFEEYLKKKKKKGSKPKRLNIRTLIKDVGDKFPDFYAKTAKSAAAGSGGYLLYAMRNGAKLSQEKLAEKLGITAAQIDAWESGDDEKEIISLETLELASLFCDFKILYALEKIEE